MAEPGGEAQWTALNRPVVPSLVVDGRVTPILHPTQIASALGLPVAGALESTRLAWDIAPILEGWCDRIEDLDLDLLLAPTPSRGRTLRNLTVNVFHPISLLPVAWTTGRFEWDPDDDPSREAALPTADAVRDYARSAAEGWSAFLFETTDELAARDPIVGSPRGDVPYSALLASQRWHAAFHHRQLVEFLGSQGIVLPGAFSVDSLTDLDLPASVF